MRFGVMTTHGPGGHPSWKHAEVTADKLVIDPEANVPDYAAKSEAAAMLRRNLREALEKHHEDVKQHALQTNAVEPEGQHLDEAIATIQSFTKGTILESHYVQPEVVQAMREVLACEFRTQQYIHRQERK
jgi:hypothetical protein